MKLSRRFLLGSLGFILAIVLSGCGRVGPTLAGGKSVSFWVDSLNDADAHVRKKAVDKLGNVGLADPQAFPAVLTAVKDADPSVRGAAVRALPKFGPKALEAITLLAEVESADTDKEVRTAATESLRTINVRSEK